MTRSRVVSWNEMQQFFRLVHVKFRREFFNDSLTGVRTFRVRNVTSDWESILSIHSWRGVILITLMKTYSMSS